MIKMGRVLHTYMICAHTILAREIFYDMRGAAAKSLAVCENSVRA